MQSNAPSGGFGQTVHYMCENHALLIYRSFHRGGVIHLAFSHLTGDLLGSVGNDVYHSVAVYNWAENRILFSTRGHLVCYVEMQCCLCLLLRYVGCSLTLTGAFV